MTRQQVLLQEQKQQMLDDILGEETFSRSLEMKDIEYLFSPDKEIKEDGHRVDIIETEG